MPLLYLNLSYSEPAQLKYLSNNSFFAPIEKISGEIYLVCCDLSYLAYLITLFGAD